MATVITKVFIPLRVVDFKIHIPKLFSFNIRKSYLHNTSRSYFQNVSQSYFYNPSSGTSKYSSQTLKNYFHNTSSTYFQHTSKTYLRTTSKSFKKLFLSTEAKSDNVSSFQIKKRPTRTRPEGEKTPGEFSAIAFATADEYDLEKLKKGLIEQDLYVPNFVENLTDVIHAVAKYKVDREPREIFFFREGSIVLWNVSEIECGNILQFLKNYEENRYNEKMIHSESEYMVYCHAQEGKGTGLLQNGQIVLSTTTDCSEFDKYAFSNAMSLSVKLGLWEAQLNKYIDSIEYVTEDLKKGNKIKLTQEEVLRKHGELFALRHMINLSSDLLDIPDFYWDRENLEKIYTQTCSYFSINKRTKVMNEKLNHCVELIELLSTHLSDKHHVRLEWMIIILIMVEVAFETLHYIERYLS